MPIFDTVPPMSLRPRSSPRSILANSSRFRFLDGDWSSWIFGDTSKRGIETLGPFPGSVMLDVESGGPLESDGKKYDNSTSWLHRNKERQNPQCSCSVVMVYDCGIRKAREVKVGLR